MKSLMMRAAGCSSAPDKVELPPAAKLIDVCSAGEHARGCGGKNGHSLGAARDE